MRFLAGHFRAEYPVKEKGQADKYVSLPFSGFLFFELSRRLVWH